MTVRMLLRDARRLAGRARRELWPSPEVAAWKRATMLAGRVGRHVPGEIALAGYQVRYLDLMTTCPQWHDMFIEHRLRFRAASPAPRILDCGANIGLATLYFKQLYPGARVTAYEADARLTEVLRDNLARNGAADVEVVHGAVWTANEAVRFAGEGDDSGAVTGAAASAPGVVVPGIRLRDRIAAERIDLLKLDIEGAEAAVLDDCADVLDRVAAMIVEIHELDPARRVTGPMLERLRAAGYVVALDELCPLSWRQPVASAASPFPGTPLQWVVQVRAWREPAGGRA